MLSKKILPSNVCMHTLHVSSNILHKSSMWFRYLDKSAFSLDNMFDELTRQKAQE